MAFRRRADSTNVHESFSDVALLMLATFIFLLVTILISSKLANEQQIPKLQAELAELRAELDRSKSDNTRMLASLDAMAAMDVSQQMEAALRAASLSDGSGRKDFELFVDGLKDLPGTDIHLVVDATGSMHGVATFLIPVLRVIVVRSGKKLSAITWFSDRRAETYSGSMGDMFDKLMAGAPFVGHKETIGDAFRQASENAPPPGAYVLIGDEPSTDRISYFNIPSPVFTLPIGRDNPDTNWQYETMAKETGGKMMHLIFR